jgi:hypothetical protein
MNRSVISIGFWMLWLLAQTGAAAAPIRSSPPPGIVISAMDRAMLQRDLEKLDQEITSLRKLLRRDKKLLDLLADVQVFHKAVAWPLAYDEFYRTNEVLLAGNLLKEGFERARHLRAGVAPWLAATGLVIRGYVSKIDGSIQPYGVVVPVSWVQNAAKLHRLDVWLHGRDNHLTELKFISDRRKSYGEFTPSDTVVLHPYGRYCNAFKFAGEVDVFEAIDHARKSYAIDESRLAIRGFSMGGAGCWHLAVHHPGFWAGAAPGAGFAETPEYTQALAKKLRPSEYEQKLWHLYNATDYAANLFNCPTIAYSGELDKQKQAADVMAEALRSEGLELAHLIGPGVAHKYEPGIKQKLSSRFDELMADGRELWPERVRFTTWTLRYNRVSWLTVDELERHWERARVNAELIRAGVRVTTTNVAAVTLTLPEWLRSSPQLQIVIDDQKVEIQQVSHSAPVSVRLHKSGGIWRVATSGSNKRGLGKRHGLQGPIDDAFMDSFIMVRPTGTARSKAIGDWVNEELAHATNEWRAQFRGDPRVRDDISITDADIAGSNLILWGDPQSNRLLSRLVNKLPLHWSADAVGFGEDTAPSTHHVPVLIYPNPLNANRYVVLNTGFTFCEFGSASNAQQTPKLPDFALVNANTPRETRWHEGILHAGFFGEHWELTTE